MLKFICHQNHRLYLFQQDGRRKVSSCSEFFDGRIVDLCSLLQCIDSPKFLKSAIFIQFA